MKYPIFLNNGSTIGICAPSAGVGRKIDKYLESLDVLKQNGYKIKETKSVRINNLRSTSAKNRYKEFLQVLKDDEVKLVLFATGGDYMYEIMPLVDFEIIKKNPKWMMGFSDPSNLLYATTLNCDIATLYGFNATSYENKNLKEQDINFKYLQGKLIKQKSFNKRIDYENTTDLKKKYIPDHWVSKKDISFSGRCIGGCFEVVEKMIGTKYDTVSTFIEKYKEDGIVWFFDIYSENSYQFYLTLLQMKYAGYFKYCKGVLFGRVRYPHIEDPTMDYHKAADKVLGKIPHIMEMDIGHVEPCMTIVNGAIINVNYKQEKGDLSFELK